MRIKKGDTVKIQTGRDRGKTGKVLRTIAERAAVVIEGMNLLVKHLPARKAGEQGQRVRYPAPLPASRVSLVCPKCGKPTRVGMAVLADGKRERRCVKCAQTFA
ncbi:50S ribosomal protein L24 [Candidatus Uhrbacteria bacterium]|nr:50S ribosomal protein L24 [Candidatus Uhrbacteria bacterium]